MKLKLIKNAIIAIAAALIGIIIYISIRFKYSYAIGGVLALVHDVLIVISLFSIFRFEINSIFIAAILAIVGYSINDTIVSFDRIRENLNKSNNKKLDKQKLYDIVNKSIAETFSRTIYTSITTLIPIIALLILGSREIFNFNIAMLCGVIAGTYSSIFIASTIFMYFENKNLQKPKKEKVIYKEEYEEKMIKGVNC